MGSFIVHLRGTGGHGCQREKKSGEEVGLCSDPKCPDCLARKFVADMTAIGACVDEAMLIHWPYGPNIVVDDLKSKKRSGNF